MERSRTALENGGLRNQKTQWIPSGKHQFRLIFKRIYHTILLSRTEGNTNQVGRPFDGSRIYFTGKFPKGKTKC